MDRHDSRLARSRAAFLKTMAEISGLPADEVERDAVAVLCALEHRLFGSAPRKLEAQLPELIREQVQGCRLHAGQAPARLHADEFFHFVADHLDRTPKEAEAITERVFRALRLQLSPGETDHVIAQLPKDLAALWRPRAT